MAASKKQTPQPGKHEVPVELGGRMLDAVVKELFGGSWGEARRLIETGKIRLDGAVVVEPRKTVRPKATLELDPRARRPRPSTDLEPERIEFADAHVIVVDKPSGMNTVPYVGDLAARDAGRQRRSVDEREGGSLDARVRAWVAAQSKRENTTPPNLGVVHRIDAETSGLLVFTRTWLAKQSLAGQFRAHSVLRRYVAIAHGKVRAQTIETHIMEDRGDGLRGSWETRPRMGKPVGQRAITHVTPLEVLPGGATLIECRLETGRTHQIRIHLSEAGHPLLGERVYVRNYRQPQIPAPRLMLHAQKLGFVHPVDEREVVFERPPPQDFQDVLTRLRVPTD